jgi:hypothetical protein
MDEAPAEPSDIDLLVPTILDQLRSMAHRQLAAEHNPITLHTTELVHDAYLRLAGDPRVTQLGRPYFFAAAARVEDTAAALNVSPRTVKASKLPPLLFPLPNLRWSLPLRSG